MRKSDLTAFSLQLEFALAVGLGVHLTCATYLLEGDGMLVSVLCLIFRLLVPSSQWFNLRSQLLCLSRDLYLGRDPYLLTSYRTPVLFFFRACLPRRLYYIAACGVRRCHQGAQRACTDAGSRRQLWHPPPPKQQRPD